MKEPIQYINKAIPAETCSRCDNTKIISLIFFWKKFFLPGKWCRCRQLKFCYWDFDLWLRFSDGGSAFFREPYKIDVSEESGTGDDRGRGEYFRNSCKEVLLNSSGESSAVPPTAPCESSRGGEHGAAAATPRRYLPAGINSPPGRQCRPSWRYSGEREREDFQVGEVIADFADKHQMCEITLPEHDSRNKSSLSVRIAPFRVAKSRLRRLKVISEGSHRKIFKTFDPAIVTCLRN